MAQLHSKHHKYKLFLAKGTSSSPLSVLSHLFPECMAIMMVSINTILLGCAALAFRYASAGTIRPGLELETDYDPLLDQSMLGALAANGAKAHAGTCRWSNCGQDCPQGFDEVPRFQGKRVR
ncbi:hypothetical protein PMIN06_005183 [Paraphaeosphaeria minitans]